MSFGTYTLTPHQLADLAALRVLRAEEDLNMARRAQEAFPCQENEELVTLAECEYDEACQQYARVTGHTPT